MRSMTFLLVAALCAALHAGAGPVNWNSGVTYTYDAAGNITLIGTDHHVYDVAGRLVQSDMNGIRRNFEYDGFGNRTNCLQQPATNCQYGYEIDQATNRLDLPAGSYDDAGNLKKFEGRTFDYDALAMQIANHTQVPGSEFIYTADDERIAVYTVPAAQWRWTLRDPSGKVLREMTSRNGTGADELGTTAWTWTKDSVWRGDQLLASLQIEAGNATPTTYHYHLDHLGTPRRITNDTDAIVGIHDYHAYGREASGGTNEPSLTLLKYTGHERDIVGTEGSETLDYMHARYYSPTVGRFLSVDPKGRSEALDQPQRWNRYAYARNSPILLIDPDGRDERIGWWYRNFGAAGGHIEKASAAMQRVPVFNPSLRPWSGKESVHLGPVEGNVGADLRIKSDAQGNMNLTAQGGAWATTPALQVGPVGTVSLALLSNGDLLPDGLKPKGDWALGIRSLDSAASGKMDTGQASMTINAAFIGIELGVNFGAFKEVVEEAQMAAREIVSETTRAVSVAITCAGDPQCKQ